MVVVVICGRDCGCDCGYAVATYCRGEVGSYWLCHRPLDDEGGRGTKPYDHTPYEGALIGNTARDHGRLWFAVAVLIVVS